MLWELENIRNQFSHNLKKIYSTIRKLVWELKHNLVIYILIYNTQNLSVGVTGHWLALRYETNSKPVSLDPVWPDECHLKKLPRKVTSGQITKQNAIPLMLFYGKYLFWITQRYEQCTARLDAKLETGGNRKTWA